MSSRFETGSSLVASDSQRKAGTEAEGLLGESQAHSQGEHTRLTSSAPVVRTERAALEKAGK